MYGDIKITLVKTETLAEYVVRTFALERVSLLSLVTWGCLMEWGGAHLPTSPSPGAGVGGGHRCPPTRQLPGTCWEPVIG